MSTNILSEKSAQAIGDLLRAIGQPARLRILMAIGRGEACVCHLETLLGIRQANISQHLMYLRDAGLLDTQREGRYIYYSVREPSLLPIIQQVGELAGISESEIGLVLETAGVPDCPCPRCTLVRSSEILVALEEINTHPKGMDE